MTRLTELIDQDGIKAEVRSISGMPAITVTYTRAASRDSATVLSAITESGIEVDRPLSKESLERHLAWCLRGAREVDRHGAPKSSDTGRGPYAPNVLDSLAAVAVAMHTLLGNDYQEYMAAVPDNEPAGPKPDYIPEPDAEQREPTEQPGDDVAWELNIGTLVFAPTRQAVLKKVIRAVEKLHDNLDLIGAFVSIERFKDDGESDDQKSDG